MKKNLLKSTFTFSIMTVLSRITGYLRDLVLAYTFGAAGVLDAFWVSYYIPNFLRRLFAEGAFSQAFVPVLSEYHQKKGNEDTKVFLNHMAGLMMVVLSVFTLIAILVTPWLVYIFAPGFVQDTGKLALTAAMLRITFPYILFISLAAYVSGILNTYGKFGIPAFAPNFFNLALIIAALFIAPYFPAQFRVKALAWGIFIGGAIQLLFQLPFLYKLNLLPKPKVVWGDAGVKRVLKLMVPAIFGVSVAQVSVLVSSWFASFLPAGSITWLGFSDRITSFPLGVFGVAVATVVLPHLSRKYASQSQAEFSAALDWAIKFVLIIALPAVVSIAILAGPILATLLQHGATTEFDVEMMRRSLLGFTVGVPAFMLVKILASGFYSRQNIKTPVKIAATAMLANIVLAAILVFPLKHAGLALATSITSILNAALLFLTLRRYNHYQPGDGWKIFWLRLIFANFILALGLWWSSQDLSVWFSWNSFTRVWHLGLLSVGAILLYFLCLWVSGMKLRDFVLRDD